MKRLILVSVFVLVGCEVNGHVESAPTQTVTPGEVKLQGLWGRVPAGILTFCDHGNRIYTVSDTSGVGVAVVPNDPSCTR